ncbi:F-box/kelch-repeat protein At3g06240-like isoform X4 [Quercus robur]|uniref:F-box/kelch-repeat protein At3g06240-like isoform X4 n=1 Tax=Quercus robur TaxID=38942 RepID=UPI002161E7BA|nr:F-box/kelch-repeat protein At3g06240-like isoform X4 [Quercus robur]
MSKLSRDPNLSSERLPDDVVFDILSRLAVKSLMRFRWVSKSWNSIITDPIFITKHLNLNKAKSLSNNDNNGYLLYSDYDEDEDGPGPRRKDLGTAVCNSDRTFTEISRFQIPFLWVSIVGFCNGMFCLNGYVDRVIYLWNPSIKMFKSLSPPLNKSDNDKQILGFAYHSENNDYKILRIVSYYEESALSTEAQVYTLSTDSWRRFVLLFGFGSIDYTYRNPCLFFNGALHAIAYTKEHNYILRFDVNDETFQTIILPEEDYNLYECSLVVFKGSLAMNMIGCLDFDIYLWVMREYGVVDSWTEIHVELEAVDRFFCCVDNGEILFCCDSKVISYDPESPNANDLGITVGRDSWLRYTTDPMESLVLLGQGENETIRETEAGTETDTSLSLEENSRETESSSDTLPLSSKYPSLPSWEVQVTNDSGEFETMLVPRSKHVPYVPWTGGPAEADFVEEFYSLIESMKNWISSGSQLSFVRQNELSHEIGLLRNKVESQASTIKTLERCLCSLGTRDVGGSSDPVTDSVGGITPSRADEGDPMNTTVQAKEDFSQHIKRLAPQDPSHCQVHESTTLATFRSKSGHLPSGQQISLDDDDEEDKEQHTKPLAQHHGKRGHL